MAETSLPTYGEILGKGMNGNLSQFWAKQIIVDGDIFGYDRIRWIRFHQQMGGWWHFWDLLKKNLQVDLQDADHFMFM